MGAFAFLGMCFEAVTLSMDLYEVFRRFEK